MKRLILLALALCLLLTGCSLPAFLRGNTEPANTLTVYRLYTGEEGGALLQPENCVLNEGERGDAERALSLFCAETRKDHLRCALPAGVSLDGWTLDGGLALLYFSQNLHEASAMEKSTLAFGAALTLCALDEVDAVTVFAGEELLFQGLDPEDALLADTDADPYTRRLRLFFADSSDRFLVSEYHSLSLDEASSPERYVVEELLRGPNDPGLRQAIPAGTRLLSCSTENGVCTVDLSADFLENRPQTALGERLAIYSIVNSLAVLSHVDSVRILCQGQSIDPYVYRSLSEPLTLWQGAVGPASAAKGELDSWLYRPLPGLQAVTAMPCVLELTGHENALWAVVAALTEQGEPGYPHVFSDGNSVLGISRQGYSCTVDVTESFFAALNMDERSAAVGSLAASLCALEEVRAVYFTINGAEAIFEGVRYTGPWSLNTIHTVE